MWSMLLKGLKVVDASQLRALDCSIPEEFKGGNMSKDEFFELANSRVSTCLYGYTLPPYVTFGFQKVDNFTQLLEEDPQRLLQDYFEFIAADTPIVVSILDGSTIRAYLENEDDFATLAENLFKNIETNEEGEINIGLVQNALSSFGPKIGVDSFLDLPIVDDILKKHGVIEEGEERVDQAQFTELLKLILQDIADTLALNNITIPRYEVQIANGELARQWSEDEEFLGALLYNETSYISEDEDRSFEDVFKNYLKGTAVAWRIPPFYADDEDVVHLYDVVFSDDDYKKRAIDLNKNEVGELAKRILEKFASELEAKPLLYVEYRSSDIA